MVCVGAQAQTGHDFFWHSVRNSICRSEKRSSHKSFLSELIQKFIKFRFKFPPLGRTEWETKRFKISRYRVATLCCPLMSQLNVLLNVNSVAS